MTDDGQKFNLHLLVRDVGQVRAVSRLGRILRVDVQILEDNGLGEGGLVVDPGATLAVTTGANLEEEGAVHLVLLGAEDGSQVFGHVDCSLLFGK